MQKMSNRTILILAGGLAGIAGALLTAVSDLILLGRPDNAYFFFKYGTEIMAGLAPWRITAGTFLGVFVLPLQLAGLLTVYHGLKPGGTLKTFTVMAALGHALVMGVAFHTSYAYMGSGWKLFHGMSPENSAVSGMMRSFDGYWKIIIYTIFAELLIGSVLFTYTVLTGKTMYPKWMALLNPFCVFLFMFPVIIALPAPAGGYIAPAYMNLSTAVFLVISTAVVYKQSMRQKSR